MSRSGNLLLDADPVRTALSALTCSSNKLKYFQEERVVVRSEWTREKVAIVSGGGSGHEPFAAGLVGKGGITGAVCGSVFASPPAGSVLAAIREVTGPSGCLLVVFNYTGDRINFGLAANRAKAEGLKVEVKFVQDDCALESEDKAVGRRGLLGGIAALKIVSAAAEEGKSLKELSSIFDQITDPSNLGTIGFSTSGCSLPVGNTGIALSPGELELGLGVHGEPGIRKWNFTNNTDLIAELLPLIQNRLKLGHNDRVLLLVNNLGGLTEIEVLNIIKCIQDQVKNIGAEIIRMGNGHIMTSLDMAGLNFSILKVTDTVTKWIDASTEMLGWPPITRPGGKSLPKSQFSTMLNTNKTSEVICDLKSLKETIKFVCESLLKAEVELNDLDALTGDGDCGSTVKLGAQGILKTLEQSKSVTYSDLVFEIASILEEEMGGSSGSLMSILFTAIAAELKLSYKSSSMTTIAKALKSGIQEMMHVGRAQPGDRTMLDALIPAQEAIQNNADSKKNALKAAADAAENGAKLTATMIAKAGRAAYCKDRNESKSPDAGAVMISKVFAAINVANQN